MRRRSAPERAAVESMTADLGVGGTLRDVCPFCGGGTGKERSLAVSHVEPGVFLYICHRAHCGARGVVRGAGLADHTKAVWRAPVAVPEPQVGPIPDAVAQYLWKHWHLAAPPADWGWEESTQRLVMTVRGPLHERRGWVKRSLSPLNRPKSLNVCPDPSRPWCAWQVSPESTRVWVVEDIPSAVRLQQYGETALALMGCHASAEVRDELTTEARGRPILIALDRDATRLALALVEALSLSYRGVVRASILPRDVKDMTELEIHECLRSGC